MRTWENDCVGCPQGCVAYCNRKQYYVVIWCDKCGEQVEPDDVVEIGRKDYCPDCYKEMEVEE